MYEENKSNINWFKIGLRIIIILLVLVLTIKLISLVVENRANVKQENLMTEKIKELETVGKEYLKDSLPTNSGESITVTLQELIDKKLIEEIKNTNNEICNTKETFVKITRLDNEYQIKTNLVCENYSDYINSFEKIENKEIPVTTTTTAKKVTTTKKTTTTKKKTTTTTKVTTTVPTKKTYVVSFNSNGGNIIESQIIEENKLISKPIPVREGYKFVGWYYYGQEFNFSTKVYQNYVLTAKWVKE